ncbi:MAG: metal ABC transporter permease [Candidatus Uhrbacteria bacterium]
MPLLDLLTFPFLQRAIIAGLILGLLLACLGVYVTLKKMAFFGDGIAHASLAGIAIAILAGVTPMPVALVWSLLVAIFIFYLERKIKLSTDSLIGILFTASMALGVVLMRFTPGYQPDLVSYLFGSILSIQTFDLWITATLAAMILLWLFSSFRALTFLSLSEESAAVSGVKVWLHTLLLYISLAIATVLAVKMLGIVLVSALLIIPPAIGRILAQNFKQYFIFSIIAAEVTILAGLFFSLQFDLPSGASIVLTGTGLFCLATIFKRKTV